MRSGFAYEPMVCRECGETIVPGSQEARRASSPAAAIYVCKCGFRYSNSRDPTARTAFAPTAAYNVPERFRSELTTTLKAAANVGNRPSKLSKFTYSTSEDAVTWTVFRWLQQERALGLVAGAIGSRPPQGDPEILFWGAPVGGRPTDLSEELKTICLGIDGNRDRLTEPDVVIAWPTEVFFVEVKYRAKNEHKSGYGHFPLYTTGAGAEGLFALPPAEVAAEGWYELTRNWRIGSEVARERVAGFTLVNLAPTRRKSEASAFRATIAQANAHRFAFLTWKQLLGLVRKQITVPADIEAFLRQRNLEGGRWG
jgi:hypothetical protein